MDSPRKLTSLENSLGTVFRSETSAMNLLTKGVRSVSVTGSKTSRHACRDTTWMFVQGARAHAEWFSKLFQGIYQAFKL